MNKKNIILIAILILFVSPIKAWSWSYIYDSSNELLYVGSYSYLKMFRDFEWHNQDKFKYLEKTIYEIDIRKKAKHEIFKTEKSIYGIKLSVKGYLAISTCSNDKCDLLVLNRKWERIKEIKEVPATIKKQFFFWSPDGSKIAYLKGDINKYNSKIAYSSYVWIYDVETGEISKAEEKGNDISWAQYDSNIYVRVNQDDTGVVYMYDPKARKGQWTRRKGIWFSSDGQYYVGTKAFEGMDTMEEDYFIYKSSDNSVYYSFKDDMDSSDLIFSGWLGYGSFIGNQNYYLMLNAQGQYKILDIESKKILRKEKKKRLIGWNKDMTKVVVYEGGDKIHIDELLTGKRLKSIEIPK